MKKERGIGNEAVMNEVRRLAEVRWASGLSGDKSQLMLEASWARLALFKARVRMLVRLCRVGLLSLAAARTREVEPVRRLDSPRCG